MLDALSSWMLVHADQWDIQSASRWLTGSLAGAQWSDVALSMCALLIGGAAIIALSRRLNVLRLGDDLAASLGIRVGMSQIAIIIVAVSMLSVATAAVGPIAFVSFLSGPIARRLSGHGDSALTGIGAGRSEPRTGFRYCGAAPRLRAAAGRGRHQCDRRAGSGDIDDIGRKKGKSGMIDHPRRRAGGAETAHSALQTDAANGIAGDTDHMQASNLSVGYGTHIVVNDIDLDIRPGSVGSDNRTERMRQIHLAADARAIAENTQWRGSA
jgi:ABC-type multidrug transport system fused ATPase/permease subunit